MMREVKAVIRPQRFDHVMEALRAIPQLPGLTVLKVHAHATGPHDGELSSPDRLEADFTKLEMVVRADIVDRVVAAISQAGHTGKAGDGIVLVTPIESFVRIREVGDSGSSTFSGTPSDA